MRVGSWYGLSVLGSDKGEELVEEKGWFWSCTLRGFGSSLYGVTGCL